MESIKELGIKRLSIRNWNDSLISYNVDDIINDVSGDNDNYDVSSSSLSPLYNLLLLLISSPQLPDVFKRHFISQFKTNIKEHFLSIKLPKQFFSLKLPSYNLLHSVIGHRNATYCLKFDRTGQRFITGGDDSLLKIWSTEWATLLHSPRGHEDCISDISICPFNEILASSSLDGFISLWDLFSGRPLFTINAFSSITMLQFQPKVAQNRREPLILMAACSDGYVKYWAICPHTKSLKNTMPYRLNCKNGSRDEIRVATFSDGGLKVISGTKDGLVRIHDVPCLDEIINSSSLPPTTPPSLLNHLGHINTISTSSKSSKFLTGSSDGTIKEWTFGDDLTSILDDRIGWSPLTFNTALKDGAHHHHQSNNIHPKKVTQTLYIGERDEFFVAAINGSFELLIYSSLKPECDPIIINRHYGEVYCLSRHPIIPTIFLSAGCDGQAIVWNFSSLRCIPDVLFEFLLPGIRFLDAQFGPGGEEIVLVDDHGRFHLIGSSPNYCCKDFLSIPCSQFFPSDLLTILAPSLSEDPCTLRRNHMMRSLENGLLINDSSSREEIISYEKRGKKNTPLLSTFYLSLLDGPSLRDDPYYSQILLYSSSLQAHSHLQDLSLKERESTFRFQQMLKKTSSRRPVLFGSDVEDGDELVEMYVGGSVATGTATTTTTGTTNRRRPVVILDGDDDDDDSFRGNILQFNETDTDISPSSNSPIRQSRRLRRTIEIEDDDDNHLLARNGVDGDDSEEYIQEDGGGGGSSFSESRRLRRLQNRERRREERRERRRVRRRQNNTSIIRKKKVEHSRSEDFLAWQTSCVKKNLVNILPYNPQIGDKVIVIKGGYKEYGGMSDLDFVGDFFRGEIRDVVWDIVNDADIGTSIMITIFFTDMVSTLTYSDKTDLADWVIPEFLYNFSMRDEHLLFLQSGNEVLLNFGCDLKEGRISTCSQRMLKRNPWKSIRCTFGGDGGASASASDESDLFSPWEVFGYGESLRIENQFIEGEEIGRKLAEFLASLPDIDADLIDMVDFDQFPTYLSIIAYPVSLGLIRDRLLNSCYRSVLHLMREIGIFYENVIKFNRSKSSISRRAKKLMNHILSYIEEYRSSQHHRRLRRIPPLVDDDDDDDDDDQQQQQQRQRQQRRPNLRLSPRSSQSNTSSPRRTVRRRISSSSRVNSPLRRVATTNNTATTTTRSNTPYMLRDTLSSPNTANGRRRENMTANTNNTNRRSRRSTSYYEAPLSLQELEFSSEI